MLIRGLNKNCFHIKQCVLKKYDLILEKALKITFMTLSKQRIKPLDDNDRSKESNKEILFAIQSKEYQGSHV